MKVGFIQRRKDQPPRLLCEAEIYFDDGTPLEGMKLEGLSIWVSEQGEYYVQFPAKRIKVSSSNRFFDYLRPATSQNGSATGRETAQRVKAWVLHEWDFANRPGVEQAKEAMA